jgi:hypothetical protein
MRDSTTGVVKSAGESKLLRLARGVEIRKLRTPPYPSVFGSVLLAVARAQVRRWDRALSRLEQEQERVLIDIVRHAQRTDFGRRHDFRSVRRYDDFAQRVPLGDYDSFSPHLDRMRSGERNLLVPEFVRHFGNSSGSSTQGKSKFLPISERQIAEQRRAGADALMRYLVSAGDDGFTRGYTLGLFPPTAMREEGAVLITSNPALMVTRMPIATRPLYLPHDDIKSMGDYEKKMTAIAERYLDWDVRAAAGTTCWFTILFDKVLEVARRRRKHVRHVADVWPNLRVLLGGGVSADPYLPVLRRQIGRDDVVLVDTYNATEGGIYAASDFSGQPGMLLLPHRGTFFEFIPLEERERPNATRVPLWAVEPNRLYSIVVTTVSGLYAYEVGDIVRFPSVRPPRIEFAGRLSGCLSVTQELTTHVEIERAVAYAVAKCGCRTIDFGAAADVGVRGTGKSRYVLFAEFDEGAEPSSLTAFAAAFDEGLRAENRVYREHRTDDVAIVAPEVVELVPGGARRFLDEITRGNVQGKFPRILDDSRKAKLLSFARRSSSPTPRESE